MTAITIRTLREMKREKHRFACVTSYDATFARLAQEAGIETILIGDSLGMVLQGNTNTLPVRIEDMVYHTHCVSRGASQSLLIADMPFMSYATSGDTLRNAGLLMQAGAHVVKLEGGDWLLESIRLLSERGVPVCGHLGLTPQSVNSFGGFVVQGRHPEQARKILDDAVKLQSAGASLLVLECIPRDLATAITAQLDIPVIGIGAGPNTDGQVLVMHDLLGLNPRPPRFVQNFLTDGRDIRAAFQAFASAVRDGSFPRAEHSFD